MAKIQKQDAMALTGCWGIVDAILGHARRILLYGPPGTGKSHAATINRRPNQRVWSVTLTPDTPAAELRGHYVPRGSEFCWQDGPAVTARYRTPNGRLVLNEINLGGPDVLALLYAVLDDDTTSCLTLPTGETLIAASGTEVIATMNGEPADLPEALLDRFPVRIRCDSIHPAAIAALPIDIRDAATALAMHADPERRVGIRALRGFSDLCASGVAYETAASAVWGERATDILDALTVARANGPAAGR